ncbi:pregnancy-specific glycoprotein 22-like isoform X2 [Carcharodon carcharias]|uniref:pregnancy-specific glycoprotein 22-like isoform X2 n=1 Tax=Carcharodon carcharias TaxID=13397 RepID=UPI001B7E432E|nr:pregnancy-specific glycoprotein 22-like isoform X2 [Carcharodon carcharias]
MIRPLLTAVALCLLMDEAEPQGFTILTENSRINVAEGGNALFSVKPSGAVRSGNWDFKGETLGRWIRTTVDFNNEYRTWAEIFLPNGSLLLKSVTVSDSGDYTISMTPVNGSEATATIALHVLAEPQGFTILTENSRINVAEGGNALFSVKPSGAVRSGNWDFKGETLVRWIRTTVDFNNEYRTWAEIFLPNGSLLLKSVTVSDSGDYTISMTPVNGSEATATIALHVLAEPQGFTILTENSRINVAEGGNALFSVKPSGAVRSGNWDFKGETLVRWIRTTVDFNNEYRTWAEIFLPNGSLLLKSVTVSDSGDYTISMTPVNGSEATATIALHVLAEPQGFTILTENSRINVAEGGNALFSVKPSGAVRSGNWDFKGETLVRWIRTTVDFNNEYRTWAEIFLPNGSLLLKSVTVSDSGDYTISMTPVNGSEATATIALHVLAEPQGFTILTENSRINVAEGGNALFSVKPSGAVRSGNWDFKGETLGRWIRTTVDFSTEYRTRAGIFLPNGSLLLKSLTVSDSGDYTISMTPVNGSESTATITLHVLEQHFSTNELGSGHKAGIVIAVLLILGMIGGISAWLIKKKACWMQESTQGQNATNISPRENSSPAARGENSASAYENIPRKQKEQATKPLEEESTYMGLQVQDRSVYNELMRR